MVRKYTQKRDDQPGWDIETHHGEVHKPDWQVYIVKLVLYQSEVEESSIGQRTFGVLNPFDFSFLNCLYVRLRLIKIGNEKVYMMFTVSKIIFG